MPPIAIRFLYPPSFGHPGGAKSHTRVTPRIILDRPLPVTSTAIPPSPLISSSSTTPSDAGVQTPQTDVSFQSAQNRKRKAATVANGPSPKTRCVTIKPLFRPILERCAAYDPSVDQSTVKPTHSAGLANGEQQYLHPYSPTSDWGNHRAAKPSREEEIRDERLAKVKKMNKDEKKARKEGITRMQELVKEMKAGAKGEVYVPKSSEEIAANNTPSVGTPVPSETPASGTKATKNGKVKKSPASQSNTHMSPTNSHGTRAKSHSPPSKKSALQPEEVVEAPQTVPLASGKIKPGRKKAAVPEASVFLRERSRRYSGSDENDGIRSSL
ncbi:hypothetical protein CNBG0780 [Cryptococcus deneoformans B-3501A]|uniref:hypothetical protein n=1 Tax=Cryptococcus deneoformans (strain B-3501A) TaxID=283643 RepID=UPI000042F790|nr:hypothetical protein CNBG0780 [Cryptococcus neoformans var. neoformans B-3501A]EAL19785.1 hypothetical protein CNBG0780 [Cryptococcus neoformans var. neoformans B-3501A]